LNLALAAFVSTAGKTGNKYYPLTKSELEKLREDAYPIVGPMRGPSIPVAFRTADENDKSNTPTSSRVEEQPVQYPIVSRTPSSVETEPSHLVQRSKYKMNDPQKVPESALHRVSEVKSDDHDAEIVESDGDREEAAAASREEGTSVTTDEDRPIVGTPEPKEATNQENEETRNPETEDKPSFLHKVGRLTGLDRVDGDAFLGYHNMI
jgi:hypothetical protein